jgi:hypothetical protein
MRFTVSHRFIAALCGCLLSLVLCGAAQARILAGNIYQGEGFHLYVDLKEGTFSEVLRFMHVKSSPRERLDLSAMGETGDRIFVGTDYFLYCQRRDDAGAPEKDPVKIGRAHKLWEIKLADGAALAEVESVLNNFVGEAGKKTLKATVAKVETKATDVDRAGMKFWLDEIVYQSDSPGSRRGKISNLQVILGGVQAALPSKTDDVQDRFNNFKIFTKFLKEAKDSDLVGFRDLLAKKIQAVQKERDAAKGDAEKFDPILKEYEKLRESVVKRTEGY